MSSIVKVDVQFSTSCPNEQELRHKFTEFLDKNYPDLSVLKITKCKIRKHKQPAKPKETKRPRHEIPAISGIADETPFRTILFGKATLQERQLNSGVGVIDPPKNTECCGPKCGYCLQAPCVTSINFECKGSRAPDIRNHSFRHKDYRRYWKFLKEKGFWETTVYQNMKTAAALSADDILELMPVCVINDVRERFPNPPGIPYRRHKRA